MRPGRIQQQKWKPPIPRNQPQPLTHYAPPIYLITPRAELAINSTRYRTCSASGSSPTISRIATNASEVFIFDPHSNRYAFRSPLHLLRRKPAPLQSNLVEPIRMIVPLDGSERVRKHILRNRRAPADIAVSPNPAMLMYRAHRPNRRVVLDNHMPGQRGSIRQNAPIPNMRVVPDMRQRHDKTPRPNRRHPTPTRRSPRDRHRLSHYGIVPHFQACRLPRILQVLRPAPETRKRVHRHPRPKGRMPIQHYMRDKLTILSQRNIRPNRAVWPNYTGFRYPRPTRHNGCPMYPRAQAPASSFKRTFRTRGTTWHRMVASQTSLPSTVISPRIFAPRLRQLITVA